MNIPLSNFTNHSQYTLRAGRDFLAERQVQDEPSAASADFNQVLEATGSNTDTVEIGTVDQVATSDPTASMLFQALAGNLASSASPVLAQTSDQSSLLRVTGINAAAATGPFGNGQTRQSEDFQAQSIDLDSMESSQYPAASGPGDFTRSYDSLRSAGRMNPPIGTRVDLKG